MSIIHFTKPTKSFSTTSPTKALLMDGFENEEEPLGRISRGLLELIRKIGSVFVDYKSC